MALCLCVFVVVCGMLLRAAYYDSVVSCSATAEHSPFSLLPCPPSQLDGAVVGLDCCEWPAEHMVIGSDAGSLVFCDMAGSKPTVIMRSHTLQPGPQEAGIGGITALAFDSTGGVLGTVGADGALKVWDHTLGIEVPSPPPPRSPVSLRVVCYFIYWHALPPACSLLISTDK